MVKFVECEQVVIAHNRQIEKYGGSRGLRDEGLLLSALGNPQNKYNYNSGDIATIAASYAFSLIKNHPFIDGNKRVDWAVTRLFLLINKYDINLTQSERYNYCINLASSVISEDEFADFIRSSLVKL